MRRIYILPLLITGTILSCKKEGNAQERPDATKKEYPKLEKAEWFIGEWANKTAQGELTERWKKVNDSVFHGESYFVTADKDTVFAETVVLAEANGILAYTVTVPGQNNEAPVRFEATSINNDNIVFENPDHDYPNKITYNKAAGDSLVAEILGVKDGKAASERFAMKKQ